MLQLTRAASHLKLNVCQLSHDMLLIRLKPLTGCLIYIRITNWWGFRLPVFRVFNKLTIFWKNIQRNFSCCHNDSIIYIFICIWEPHNYFFSVFKAGQTTRVKEINKEYISFVDSVCTKWTWVVIQRQAVSFQYSMLAWLWISLFHYEPNINPKTVNSWNNDLSQRCRKVGTAHLP